MRERSEAFAFKIDGINQRITYKNRVYYTCLFFSRRYRFYWHWRSRFQCTPFPTVYLSSPPTSPLPLTPSHTHLHSSILLFFSSLPLSQKRGNHLLTPHPQPMRQHRILRLRARRHLHHLLPSLLPSLLPPLLPPHRPKPPSSPLHPLTAR